MIEQEIVFKENTDEIYANVNKNIEAMHNAQQQYFRAQESGLKELENHWKRVIDKTNERLIAEKKAAEQVKAATELQIKQNRELQQQQGFMGRVITKLKDYHKSLSDTNKAGEGTEQSGKGVAGVFNLIFTAAKRLFVIGAITELFLKFEAVGKLVDNAMLAISTTFATLSNNGEKLIDILISAVTFDFQGLGNGLSEVKNEITNAVNEAFRLRQVFADLAEFDRAFSVVAAQVKLDADRLKSAAEDTNKSYRERNSLFLKAAGLEKGVVEQYKVSNREANGALQASLKIAGNETQRNQIRDKIAENQIEFIELNRIEFEIQEDLRKNEKALRKEQEEAAKKRAEEAKKLAQELKELENIQDRIKKQTREFSARGENSQQEELKQLRDSALEESRILEEDTLKRLEAIKRSDTEIAEFKRDFSDLRLAIEKKYLEDLRELIEKESKKEFDRLEQLGEDELNRRKEKQANLIRNIKEEEEIQIKRVDLLKDLRDKELTDEEIKEARKLQIQISSLEKQRKVLEEFGKGDTREAQIIDIDIELLQQKLNKISGLNLSPIDSLKRKIANIFQLNDEELKFAKEQLGVALGNIFDGFTANTDRLLADNDRLIEGINKKIEAIKGRLNEELELQKQGYANDAEELQSQLDEQNRIREEAEAKRLEIEKKAANQRLFQESLQQASSIFTAATSLVASEASKGLIGVITAISGLALLFKIINTAKSNAAQFAKKPVYREGGLLDFGGSHDSGNDIAGYDEKGSYKARFERGEYILNKGTVAENLPFIEKLNEGVYDNVDLDKVFRPSDFRHNPLPSIAPYLADMNTKVNEHFKMEYEAKIRENESLRHELSDLITEMKAVKQSIDEKPFAVTLDNGDLLILSGRGKTFKTLSKEKVKIKI